MEDCEETIGNYINIMDNDKLSLLEDEFNPLIDEYNKLADKAVVNMQIIYFECVLSIINIFQKTKLNLEFRYYHFYFKQDRSEYCFCYRNAHEQKIWDEFFSVEEQEEFLNIENRIKNIMHMPFYFYFARNYKRGSIGVKITMNPLIVDFGCPKLDNEFSAYVNKKYIEKGMVESNEIKKQIRI